MELYPYPRQRLCECYSLAGSSKSDACERIIRVPAVMRWKDELTERQIIRTPVTVMDVMPTVLELLNHSNGAFYSDGKSLVPVLFNSSQESQHKYIFHYVEVTKPAAVTSGPYKVVYTEIKGKHQVCEMQQIFATWVIVLSLACKVSFIKQFLVLVSNQYA